MKRDRSSERFTADPSSGTYKNQHAQTNRRNHYLFTCFTYSESAAVEDLLREDDEKKNFCIVQKKPRKLANKIEGLVLKLLVWLVSLFFFRFQ